MSGRLPSVCLFLRRISSPARTPTPTHDQGFFSWVGEIPFEGGLSRHLHSVGFIDLGQHSRIPNAQVPLSNECLDLGISRPSRRSGSVRICCRWGRAAESSNTRTRQQTKRYFAGHVTETSDRFCWSCKNELAAGHKLFCEACNSIQPVDPAVDYYKIFEIKPYFGVSSYPKENTQISNPRFVHSQLDIQLPRFRDRAFDVDRKLLEQKYKNLQKKLHPDLVASKPKEEQEHSAEQSARVIQAYYTLLRPLSRARYLLQLQGIEVEEEGTIHDPDLLMEIMEIRESIEDVHDPGQLAEVQAENKERMLRCEEQLDDFFEAGDLRQAISGVQRLAYYNKIGEEILRRM